VAHFALVNALLAVQEHACKIARRHAIDIKLVVVVACELGQNCFLLALEPVIGFRCHRQPPSCQRTTLEAIMGRCTQFTSTVHLMVAPKLGRWSYVQGDTKVSTTRVRSQRYLRVDDRHSFLAVAVVRRRHIRKETSPVHSIDAGIVARVCPCPVGEHRERNANVAIVELLAQSAIFGVLRIGFAAVQAR